MNVYHFHLVFVNLIKECILIGKFLPTLICFQDTLKRKYWSDKKKRGDYLTWKGKEKESSFFGKKSKPEDDKVSELLTILKKLLIFL